jgi:hypothetical protein
MLSKLQFRIFFLFLFPLLLVAQSNVKSSEQGFPQTLISTSELKPINESNSKTKDINTQLHFEDHKIIVAEQDAEYQWLDCDNAYSNLACQKQYYVPNANGHYAVIVKKKNEVDTSVCFEIKQFTQQLMAGTDQYISVEPLQNNGVFMVNASKKLDRIVVVDILGNVIWKTRPTELRTMIAIKDKPNGDYFLNLELNGKYQTFLVTKQ